MICTAVERESCLGMLVAWQWTAMGHGTLSELADVFGEQSTDDPPLSTSPSAVDRYSDTIALRHPSPDLAACSACLAETRDRDARRHRYPFTCCAACGPRYSIATRMPFDRRHTSMRTFVMCDDCASQYDDSTDRHHHAQPIACPSCGPELSLLAPDGRILASDQSAIMAAALQLTEGGILAVRGLGGFQLFCDATHPRAVGILRSRKGSLHRPLAVMFRDREQLSAHAEPTEDEWRTLTSPEAPIVLVRRRAGSDLDERVASGAARLGALLPSTPLHALLLDGAGVPLVCTSGNAAGEPPCVNGEQATISLGSIADGMLDHDRSIVRALEDSIVRVTPRRTVVLRRGRGFVPRSVGEVDPRASVLAFGAQQSGTITVAHRGVLIPSTHLGDLDSPRACHQLAEVVRDTCAFYGVEPTLLACDRNPVYASSALADQLGTEWNVPLIHVQHHHAHVAAVMAEHAFDSERRVLGLVWDGTGTSEDGSLWGGETLVCHGTEMNRIATIGAFPLIGGDRAPLDPRRVAMGVLFEHLQAELAEYRQAWSAVTPRASVEIDSCLHVLERRLAPMCSSVARLFEAVAALLGVCERTTYAGHGLSALEDLAASVEPDGAYPFPIVRDRRSGLLAGDTQALVSAIVQDLRRGIEKGRIARRCHEALIAFGVAIAEQAGIEDVIATGECFENRLLADGLEERLERAGFQVHLAASVPPNDGGVSVGQAWLAAQHAVARPRE